MLTDLLPFVAASLVVVLFPGPDFTLVMRNAAIGGSASARATAAGILTGNVVLAVLAVLGLTAVLRGSETAYLVLKVAGAGYLLWIGAGALRDWWRLRGEDSPATAAQERPARVHRPGRSFRQGLLSNLLNPKVAMFYLALFPQFHVGTLGPTQGALVLAGTFLVIVVAWYAVLLAATRAVEGFLARRRTRRALAGTTGIALTGMSVALLRG